MLGWQTAEIFNISSLILGNRSNNNRNRMYCIYYGCHATAHVSCASVLRKMRSNSTPLTIITTTLLV